LGFPVRGLRGHHCPVGEQERWLQRPSLRPPVGGLRPLVPALGSPRRRRACSRRASLWLLITQYVVRWRRLGAGRSSPALAGTGSRRSSSCGASGPVGHARAWPGRPSGTRAALLRSRSAGRCAPNARGRCRYGLGRPRRAYRCRPNGKRSGRGSPWPVRETLVTGHAVLPHPPFGPHRAVTVPPQPRRRVRARPFHDRRLSVEEHCPLGGRAVGFWCGIEPRLKTRGYNDGCRRQGNLLSGGPQRVLLAPTEACLNFISEFWGGPFGAASSRQPAKGTSVLVRTHWPSASRWAQPSAAKIAKYFRTLPG